MLNAMRRSKQRKAQAAGLYAAVARRAREPEFFARFAVEDTLDGRFDLLTLHAWLLLERLKAAGAAPLSQAFVDTVFIGFDEALRELGSGDIGMGRRMKKLADAFYGRLQAYGEARDEAALEEALVRNLYRGAREPAARAMARYVLGAKARLDGCDLESLDFGSLPDEE